jgi:hypothetical protein
MKKLEEQGGVGGVRGAGGANLDFTSMLSIHEQVMIAPASTLMEEKVNEKIENPRQAQPWMAK